MLIVSEDSVLGDSVLGDSVLGDSVLLQPTIKTAKANTSGSAGKSFVIVIFCNAFAFYRLILC